MNSKYHPRALDLNAPLLSTRRPQLGGDRSSQLRGTITSEGIPFSWEQVPGKPKDVEKLRASDDSGSIAETPRPRLPPSRWHDALQRLGPDQETRNGVGGNGKRSVLRSSVDDEEEEDVFSNAVDVFSLSEAIDILEKAEGSKSEARHQEPNSNTDRLKLKVTAAAGEESSPDFMINRFLPDASALALASASSALKNIDTLKDLNDVERRVKYSPNNCSDYRREQARVSPSTGKVSSLTRTTSANASKGCGIENLFAWRIKPRFCGDHKSVDHVRQPYSNAKKPKNMEL